MKIVITIALLILVVCSMISAAKAISSSNNANVHLSPLIQCEMIKRKTYNSPYAKVEYGLHEEEEMTKWWELHDQAKQECEENILVQDVENTLDCDTYCSRGGQLCDAVYYSDYVSCNVDVKIFDFGNYWQYFFNASASGTSECTCTTPSPYPY